MFRPLLAAALLVPASARAQPAPSPPPRQMPSYQDSDAQWKGGSSETYGTADLHHQVDQTPPPPPVPEGYGAYDAPGVNDGGQAASPDPRGYQRGGSGFDDTLHRADSARTAQRVARRRAQDDACRSGDTSGCDAPR